MKPTRIRLYLALFGLLFSVHVWAQRPGVSPTFEYSVDDCIRYALQFQQAVKEAKLQRASSAAQVDELLAVGYPQISATAGVQYAIRILQTPVPLEFVTGGATDPDGNPIIPPGTEVVGDNALLQFGTRWQSSAGVQLEQLLLDGTYFLGVKAAKEVVVLQKYNVNRTEVDAIATIKKAYYNVLVSEQRSRLLNTNIESLEATLKDTEALFKEGYVEQIDLDRLRVQINNLQTERRKIAQLVELNVDLLKFQMGMDPSVNLVLTDALDPAQLNKALADTSFVYDPSKRYEHKLLKQRIYLQTLNQKRFRSDYYPKIYGSFNYSTQFFSNDFGDHFDGQNWFGVSNVGVQVRWKIFDGLATRARIQQAKIDEMLYKSQLENFENGMKLEIRQATTNLRNATMELENQERNLELAEEVFRVTNIKYAEGVGTNLEVVNAQTSLNEAQINYTDAMIQAYIATVDLDKALGNLSPSAYK